jgi:hypothetical protein
MSTEIQYASFALLYVWFVQKQNDVIAADTCKSPLTNNFFAALYVGFVQRLFDAIEADACKLPPLSKFLVDTVHKDELNHKSTSRNTLRLLTVMRKLNHQESRIKNQESRVLVFL